MEGSVVVLRAGWLPTRQANGIQTVRMCEAFAALGLRVSLYYIPQPGRPKDIVQHYAIKAPIDLRPLPRAILPVRKHFKLKNGGAVTPSFIHAFLWSSLVVQLSSREKPLFYFVREPMLAWWLGVRRLPTVFEIHHDYTAGGIENPFTRSACRRKSVKTVVAVTEHLRDDLISLFDVPPEKTLALPNGVDLGRFANACPGAEARRRLGLRPEDDVVLYAGQLHSEKGVDILVRAAAALKTITVVIVGGDAADKDRLRRLMLELDTHNVVLLDYVPATEVPVYLKAASVLALPHSGKVVESGKYTCPLKLFEYMAAGVPIVASALPAIKEIIRHGENGWLVEPDSPTALAEGLRHLIQNKSLAASLAQRAAHDAESYTWERRAERILDSLLERQSPQPRPASAKTDGPRAAGRAAGSAS